MLYDTELSITVLQCLYTVNSQKLL